MIAFGVVRHTIIGAGNLSFDLFHEMNQPFLALQFKRKSLSRISCYKKVQKQIKSTKSRSHICRYKYNLQLIRNCLQEYGSQPFLLRKCWNSKTTWKLYHTTLAISHYILLGTDILPWSPAQSWISINLAEGLSSLPNITAKLHNTTLSFCQNTAPSD